MALFLHSADPKVPPQSRWKRLLQQILSPWREFDGILLATVLALTGIGIVAIRSAVWERPISHYWLQQLIMAGISLVFLAMVARIPYERLLRWHWFTYGLTLAGLVAVLFFGTAGGGAERWISIAGVHWYAPVKSPSKGRSPSVKSSAWAFVSQSIICGCGATCQRV
jgi:rod shape determining protein RodA